MSTPAPRTAPAASPSPGTPAALVDELALAIERTASARGIAGNTLTHQPDSAAALEEMLEQITAAQRWIHFENYIIRADRTGRRFGDALAERARAGVAVRVLYDALGSIGTRGGYWRALRRAGAEVRAFHPILSGHPFDIFVRDHRKLLVTDGRRAMLGGLCIGDEWAGDAELGIEPWRDTMVSVCGPAAAALDRTFADVWRHCGAPLPPEELAVDPDVCGECAVHVVSGVPFEGRIYRTTHLIAAAARERLWITDAYLVPPAPLYAALLDAARAGVDVRLLVPGASDLPIMRNFTRVGYRELLRAGVRVFEWLGPMIHAKTLVADRIWGRIGSSNLNVSSLLGNYELDLLTDDVDTADALAAQFRRDLQVSREVVLQPRRRMLPARLVGQASEETAAPRPHRRRRRAYEFSAVAVVALRRVAGGLRRAIAGTAALLCLLIGVLLLAFPRVMSIALATGTFWLGLGFAVYAFGRRRARGRDDGD
ncbi:MAG TPA: phospholipase D-like domain-containing protein [Gemmatimonadales bacterium]|nr:phospholipase D-like domain-containing protein [Gemmatimonadales bacterium]